jgi:hypothetical protein
VLLFSCKTEDTPATADLSQVAMDLSAPDLGGQPDLTPGPDLTMLPACLHGQERKPNGMCACISDDDLICGEGHCCATTNPCQPPTQETMYRCAPPAKRQRHAMAYDATRKRALLFGGMLYPDMPFGDAYEHTPDSWYPVRAAGNTPPARHSAAMAFDEVNNRLLMFGGQARALSMYFNDLWAFDGKSWTELLVPSPPSRRGLHGMVYDSNRRVMVLFGGDENGMALKNDLYEFNVATARWVQRDPGGGAGLPLPREGFGMAYDAKNRRTVIFGGVRATYAYLNDTWAWNGTNWTQIPTPGPPLGPPIRAYFSMAYDANRQVIVAFGGETVGGFFTALGDTWELDGNTWIRRTPMRSPSGRKGHSMIYDPGRKQVLMFGGQANDAMDAVSELWAWDGNTWMRLN